MSTEVVKMPPIAVEAGNVSTMMEGAVESGATRLGKRATEVLEALRRGDCCACGCVRYELGKRLAEYLGSVDHTVKVVYLYEADYATGVEEPIPDRPNLSPGMNMIVWTDRRSAALSSVVASLNAALGEEVKRFACPKANALCWTLDVQAVDDDQVQTRSGYGALVNSVYVRPLEIWHR